MRSVLACGEPLPEYPIRLTVRCVRDLMLMNESTINRMNQSIEQHTPVNNHFECSAMASATKAPEWQNDDCYGMEISCTCQKAPTVVTLEGGEQDTTDKAALMHNLQTFGWSPLRIAVCPNSLPPPTQNRILEVFRQYERQQLDKSNASENDLVYIAAESGSSQGTVEPKESLEVALSRCTMSSSDSQIDHCIPPHIQVKKWCQSLSWIARQVCTVLELPSDTFLASSSTQGSSLDLLRVFHYYALNDVVQRNNGTHGDDDNLILGSSPHTDWGSLTIVWQDHVGGLQTYCRKCQAWIDVPPPPPPSNEDDKYWQVIVHVGDMASIVLNALLSGSDSQHSSSSALWPSPKHRVVSSKTHERVSLVYFAYPPSQASLATMHQTLQTNWPLLQLKEKHCRLPLTEYFLLHDQSVGSASTRTPEEMYEEMWNLPIQNIVQLKWRQVHRGDGDDTS